MAKKTKKPKKQQKPKVRALRTAAQLHEAARIARRQGDNSRSRDLLNEAHEKERAS